MEKSYNANEYRTIEKNENEKNAEKACVNVFFAADKKYLPYLAVAIASLSNHASDEYMYRVRILTKDLTEKDILGIKEKVKKNVKISVSDISDKIFHIKEELALRLRDYYSDAIYYRLFISSMFTNLSRAVYLDSDVVLCEDVSKLYFSDIGDNLLGAVSDESVMSEPVFREYVVKYVGLESPEKYFNSGVLVMNLEGIRKEKIRERFLNLLCRYNFKTVAPDQDYLNFLCRGKVKHLECGWNKHAIDKNVIDRSKLYLMHYNMFNKPWRYEGVQNEDLFWETAKETDFYEELLLEKANYSEQMKKGDAEAGVLLIASAKELASFECESSFSSIVNEKNDDNKRKQNIKTSNKRITVKAKEKSTAKVILKTKEKASEKKKQGRAINAEGAVR